MIRRLVVAVWLLSAVHGFDFSQIDKNILRDDVPICQRDGSAFVGLSLSQMPDDGSGNPQTVTRQLQMNLCNIIDPLNRYVKGLNDDSWLVCGGISENDPSNKLAAADSAHIEVVHTGVSDQSLGGSTVPEIIRAVEATPFKPLRLKPLRVQLNHDRPPELELRFEIDNTTALWDFYTRLYDRLKQNPCTDQGDPFHVTLARKVEFRSAAHESAFLTRANVVVQKWRLMNPDGILLGTPQLGYGNAYLFLNRQTVVHVFRPTVPE